MSRGDRFERWTAVSDAYKPTGKGYYVDCVCACGTVKTVYEHSLRKGVSRSCGCLSREISAARQYRHGARSHRLYMTWHSIIDRCYNSANAKYADYGGRGIRVAPEWLGNPAAFCSWIDANLGPKPRGRSLDRINNDLGYFPGNLRWATPAMQTHNRRRPATLAEVGRLRDRIAELEGALA